MVRKLDKGFSLSLEIPDMLLQIETFRNKSLIKYQKALKNKNVLIAGMGEYLRVGERVVSTAASLSVKTSLFLWVSLSPCVHVTVVFYLSLINIYTPANHTPLGSSALKRKKMI